MDKRGISSVVTSVLLILMVVILVIALWLFLLPYLQRSDFEHDLSVSINFGEGHTCYDVSNNVSMVQVARGTSDANLSGLNVVFLKEGESHSFYPGSIYPNSKRVFMFEISGKVDEVKVAPIFLRGKKEVLGDFSSSGKILPCNRALTIVNLLHEDCGDGECDIHEDCLTCNADCGGCGSACGDGTIDAWEECGEDGLSCDSGSWDCVVCRCEPSFCDVEVVPGTDAIYNAVVASGDSTETVYDQYVICIGDGYYYESKLGETDLFVNKSGLTLIGVDASGNYVERPRVDLDGASKENPIKVLSDYITFDNLEIYNGHDAGVKVYSDYFRIYNSVFHDNWLKDISIGGDHGRVVNNTFYNSGTHTVSISGSVDLVLTNNYFWKGMCQTNLTRLDGYGLQDKNGILHITDGSTDDVVVHCNYFNASHLNGGNLPAVIGITEAPHDIIATWNYMEESIIYNQNGVNSYNLGRFSGNKGPILFSDSFSWLVPSGSFTFNNNFCNQTRSYCIDADGTSYTCCNAPADTSGYGTWKAYCGEVGAPGFVYD